MKLVLLPGMDGTSRLFDEFIDKLDYNESFAIVLPQCGDQSYTSLAAFVSRQLPKNDCIVLAESFSGGIALKLLENHSNIKAVIFAASFLSCPRPFLVNIAKYLPLSKMAMWPVSKVFLKLFIWGNNASDEQLSLFKRVMDDVQPDTLRKRLAALAHLDGLKSRSDIPALCLVAKNDKLVPSKKSNEFRQVFSNIQVVGLSGPHFLLQTNAEGAAGVIQEFINKLPE